MWKALRLWVIVSKWTYRGRSCQWAPVGFLNPRIVHSKHLILLWTVNRVRLSPSKTIPTPVVIRGFHIRHTQAAYFRKIDLFQVATGETKIRILIILSVKLEMSIVEHCLSWPSWSESFILPQESKARGELRPTTIDRDATGAWFQSQRLVRLTSPSTKHTPEYRCVVYDWVIHPPPRV